MTDLLQQASIPSNYSRILARVMELSRSQLARFLMNTGIDEKQFVDAELMITAAQQIQILENALEMDKEPALGIRLGRCLTAPTHGAIGFLAVNSPDLLTAMYAFEKFMPARMSLVNNKIVDKGDVVELHLDVKFPCSAGVRRLLAEACATIFFDSAEHILGRPLSEATTFVDFPKLENSELDEQYILGKINYSSDQLCVRIPAELCSQPNLSSSRESYNLALQQCKEILQGLNQQEQPTKYKVQKFLLNNGPGFSTEEDAARELFVSKRTLARKLAKEGTGFRKIRDELLAEQAKRYVKETNLSIDAIASMLNYHDSASFRRAFKRWFSATPDGFRKTASIV